MGLSFLAAMLVYQNGTPHGALVLIKQVFDILVAL